MNKTNKRRLFKVKYTNYFELKRYIITSAELEFYKEFLEIAQRLNLVLLTKVSIHNLVNIKDTLYKKIALKQCGTECIDFIFADKDTCRTILCVRLDYPYIRDKRKLKAERFIDELFEELNINLIRIKINEEYNYIYLENRLRQIIAHPAYKE